MKHILVIIYVIYAKTRYTYTKQKRINIYILYIISRGDKMPYNPLKYTEAVFAHLKAQGYETQVLTDDLKGAITVVTGLVRTVTISNLIKLYAQLGLIKEHGTNVWDIRFWELKDKQHPVIKEVTKW